jgi:hypothetical protein
LGVRVIGTGERLIPWRHNGSVSISPRRRTVKKNAANSPDADGAGTAARGCTTQTASHDRD